MVILSSSPGKAAVCRTISDSVSTLNVSRQEVKRRSVQHQHHSKHTDRHPAGRTSGRGPRGQQQTANHSSSARVQLNERAARWSRSAGLTLLPVCSDSEKMSLSRCRTNDSPPKFHEFMKTVRRKISIQSLQFRSFKLLVASRCERDRTSTFQMKSASPKTLNCSFKLTVGGQGGADAVFDL